MKWLDKGKIQLWELLHQGTSSPRNLECLYPYTEKNLNLERCVCWICDICWIIEKAREFQKNIYFCFIDYAKAFDCVDHNKLWKILKEKRIPDHLTCLLRNLYAGQEATVRTGHGTTDWFQIGKGVRQSCILSPCLINLYAIHHEKRWTRLSTRWNQVCCKKYQ